MFPMISEKEKKRRDPNYILENSQELIVVSSTRSLLWILNENSEDFFLDVCYSRLISGEDKCVASLYTYDVLVRIICGKNGIKTRYWVHQK